MTFAINGTDIMSYVADGGISWNRSDVQGPAKGTSITGLPIRDKIAEQYEWTISCMPLTAPQLAAMLSLIKSAYVPVTYTDPVTNTAATDGRAFCDTAGLAFKRETRDGVEYFRGLSFRVVSTIPVEA